MTERERGRKTPRFSASKRDFLKKMALFGVYFGPVIRSFEMTQVAAKPTGPPKKKEKPTTGTVRLDRASGKNRRV
ncbi:MAG: hypothetical protein R6V58_06530 [Planctomycetota bacterium]